MLNHLRSYNYCIHCVLWLSTMPTLADDFYVKGVASGKKRSTFKAEHADRYLWEDMGADKSGNII